MLAGRREGPTSLRWVAGAEAGKGAPGVRRARARARGQQRHGEPPLPAGTGGVGRRRAGTGRQEPGAVNAD